jgi:GT2 family glycosyltransferase
MSEMSILVGLRNNLDYTRAFYQKTRETYPDAEICFVSYGSTDGTHEWLNQLNDRSVKSFISNETKTLADAYNKATEIATKEYVVYAHNDMVFSDTFISDLLKDLNHNSVIAYTTVEPPVFAHHIKPGKIIHNCGDDFTNYDNENFQNFNRENAATNPGLLDWDTKTNISFFISVHRETLLNMGGLDNLFDPFFCEDDDLTRRFNLNNLDMKISLKALCYHFVSKTSRFSEEFKNTTQNIEFNSNRNYIRKWGCRTEAPKYNIVAFIANPNIDLVYHIEPFFDKILIDNDQIKSQYLQHEQNNTKINLSDKIQNTNTNIDSNYSILNIDGSKFDRNDFIFINNIMNEISKINSLGQHQIGNLTLQINSLEDHQKELIKNA